MRIFKHLETGLDLCYTNTCTYFLMPEVNNKGFTNDLKYQTESKDL